MRKNAVDRSVLKGEAYENFRQAIKSPWTRDPYERRLIRFLDLQKQTPDGFVAMARKDPGSAEKAIIKFIVDEKDRVEKKEITGATVGGTLKAIRLLLEMNDALLNWKKIRRMLPRARRYALDRRPTLEEIRAIVDHSDIRGKALTLLFVSSGLREGAIEYPMTVGDYSKIQNGHVTAGKLVAYRGDAEQYITFISPEACTALDAYLKFRQDHGETIRPDSPLFRDKFDPIVGKYGHRKENATVKVVPMSGSSIRKYYNRLLHSLGIRTEKKRRHEFQSVHSLRKYFKSTAELGGMKPINVETLMGHSTGISDSYYRPTEQELLADYVKVANNLSIMSVGKIKQEMEIEMETKIQSAVEKEIRRILTLARENPVLLNVKPDELTKLVPRSAQLDT